MPAQGNGDRAAWPESPRQAIDLARATPWKARLEVARLAWWPLIRLYFAAHGVAWGQGWRIYGLPRIQRHVGSTLTIGTDLEMRNWRYSSPLGVQHPCILTTWSAGAVLQIGHGVGVTGGAICAQRSIQIGNRVSIGANCTIVDTDFHPLGAEGRRSIVPSGPSAPVVIEDDAFIGTQVLILKGSTIGRGSVVGAGSVVIGAIPPQVVAAGNPARVIRGL